MQSAIVLSADSQLTIRTLSSETLWNQEPSFKITTSQFMIINHLQSQSVPCNPRHIQAQSLRGRMMPQKTFALVLVSLLCAFITNCSGAKLVNNGYRDIVIAVNPGVFDENLIESIKEMMYDASAYLHLATKQQLYFSEIKILLPYTWTVNSSLFQRSTTQSYAKADVIIAAPYLKHRDAPYTLQPRGCGEKGRYIHFTPNFMLNDTLASAYGSRGQAFVHEWAHLRWGVFDEYDDLTPFYITSDGTVDATRCSKEIRGKIADCTGTSCTPCNIDPNTRLPKGNCQFFPEMDQSSSSSIMYVQGLTNADKFCDDKTHNAEVPNSQNRICNYRSIWDMISKSEDFKNSSSPHTGSVIPTFTFLQAKHRVVCLVLDVSASMGLENRINKLQQAAKVFLLQIIEDGSHVGIVSFHSAAFTDSKLKLIDGDDARNELVQLLPTTASGGRNICIGVRSGFAVLRADDGSTSGDEIILVVLGEDNGINGCFAEVEQSGAIIHTIAIGQNATEELEQLSIMTGGLQFAAADNLDSNGLIDAFSALVATNGDINHQPIQLESSGTRIDNGTWMNGTVVFDKTVGNDTMFVVTWDAQTPIVIVRNPSGKTYNHDDFRINQTEHTAHLKIQGTAQTGNWIYNILNHGIKQFVTTSVTSRAADAEIPPVNVNVYMNKKDIMSPIIIYVEVTHGFLPVLHANVTAIIERPSGPPIKQKLYDDGLGADVNSDDGIYSKYFLMLNGAGRYSVNVHVQGEERIAQVALRRGGHAPQYTKNGNIQTHSANLPNKEGLVAQLGGFQRVKSGGTILVPSEALSIDFRPCKITDLQATIVKNRIKLEWTAPGGDYDQGKASHYEMRMSDNLLQLRDNFFNVNLVNLTSMKPRSFGSRETATIVLEHRELQNGATLYFAVRAYDENQRVSEMSNVAKASVFVPLIEHPNDVNISVIVSIVTIAIFIVCLIILITNCVLNSVSQKRILADEE
ncbi:calcium-activated chloride channel regulator 1-like [Leucoraja erinacea]|uniref:calcium-activated chloride channel regulator 1-like n=1 Tax=Leucoraja erinaceus TaxID=7782 RepID=UPI002457E673|nr:calcium-activated chloride channel regulator 1-like [Leucoraja erinacea]